MRPPSTPPRHPYRSYRWIVGALWIFLVLSVGVVAAGVTSAGRRAGVALGRASITTHDIDGGPVLLASASVPVRAVSSDPLPGGTPVTVPLASGARLQVTVPATPGAHPVVLYAHGGGWVGGDPADIPAEFGIGAVTDADWALVSVGYRLADDTTGVTAREQLDDVRAALAWIHDSGPSLGLGQQVVAVGHSAGAHLVSLAAATVDPAIAPDAVVAISGIYDFGPDVVAAPLLAPVLPAALGCPVGSCPADDLEPAHVVRAGEPPVTIVHGADDPIAVVATARRYAAALRGTGVEVDLRIVPGAVHDGEVLGTVVRSVLADLLATPRSN